MSFEALPDRRWDLGALARDPADGTAARPLAPYLLALGLATAAHLLVILADISPGLDGRLHGADGYLRLLRVEALWNGGDWYDDVMERNNAPYGLSMHWTRPMDALLLVGGAALTPLMDVREGFYWWAVAVSPLLHVASILALVWALTPLLGISHRCVLVVAVLLQLPLLSTGMIGRADHHMLIALGFVVALGANLRLAVGPPSPARGLAAGASLGFCLWLTMEGLVLLGICLAVAGGLWVLKGGDRLRGCLWQALGLAGMLALALAVERAPGDWLTEEYDRLSVAHLLTALLVAGFWAGAAALERLRGPESRLLLRGGLAALGAALSGAVLYGCYPKFFGGPEVDVDPVIQTVFFDWVAELKPILPRDARGLRESLIFLGSALIAVPFYLVLLWRGARSKEWDGWLPVALCGFVFLVLAISMRRFAPLAEIFLAIPVAVVLSKAMSLTERVRAGALRVALRGTATFALLFGLPGLALALPAGAPVDWTAGPCRLDRIVPLLNDPAALGDRRRLILAHFNHGPELLYRTGHAVVASPYHRNARGLLDAHEAFSAEDDRAAREVVERRGVDLVLICREGPAVTQFAAVSARAFALRLGAGRRPAWLEPVSLPEDLAGDFLLYRVVGKTS